jgi:biopolymer transport protein ExbB
MNRLLRTFPALVIAILALPAFADEAGAPNLATLPNPAATAAPPTVAAPAATSAPPEAPSSAVASNPAPLPDPAAAMRAALPHDLSAWSMFQSADNLVKAVMIGLAIASVVTWTVWFAKAFELFALKRRLRRSVQTLDTAESLADAARGPNLQGPGAELIRAALAETGRDPEASAEGIKERVASRLERIEAAAARAMSHGTGVLATIGATAPFVGLFGTVWGIMNSFIGISKAQTTNLAVVAPGIAEALLATAMGLVAAIPAVVIYNMFARQTAGCRALVGDASASVLRLVSRDLDRGCRSPKLRAAE